MKSPTIIIENTGPVHHLSIPVPPGGIIIVPQEAWEGLDPDNRAVIANAVAGRKVTVLTAEPGSGDLRAEPFNKP